MELGLPSHELRIEAPLDLGEHQEPEPDLAVVTARADAWLNAHPTAADTLLLIEVADTSTWWWMCRSPRRSSCCRARAICPC